MDWLGPQLVQVGASGPLNAESAYGNLRLGVNDNRVSGAEKLVFSIGSDPVLGGRDFQWAAIRTEGTGRILASLHRGNTLLQTNLFVFTNMPPVGVGAASDTVILHLGDGRPFDRMELCAVAGSFSITSADGVGESRFYLTDPGSLPPVRSRGTVYAFGYNGSGAIGDGSIMDHRTPTRVLGRNGDGFLTNVIAVASGGGGYSLALMPDGTVLGWGATSLGELGVRDLSPWPYPTEIQGLSNVVAIAAGDNHSLALRADGTVQAWGAGNDSQLGVDSTIAELNNYRVIVPNLSGVVAIAAGGNHSLALRFDGSVVSWGRNDFGQLGRGSSSYPLLPGAIPGLTDVIRISAGSQHCLAVRRSIAGGTSGTVWAWGHNGTGQLGFDRGLVAWSLAPVQIPGLSGISEVCASLQGSVVVATAGGQVYAFGGNYLGFLGNGIDMNALWGDHRPSLVLNLPPTRAVSGSGNHVLALGTDGTLWSWAANDAGQLGTGVAALWDMAGAVPGLTNIVGFSAGGSTSLVIADAGATSGEAVPPPLPPSGASGRVLGFGYNAWGILGDGTFTDRWTPEPVRDVDGVNFLDGVLEVVCGGGHTVALKSDGTLLAWGDNSLRQLGSEWPEYSAFPVVVEGVSNVVSIAVGGTFSLALRGDGTVFAWGDMQRDQLGMSAVSAELQGFRGVVPGLNQVIRIAAGYSHALALRSDGSVVSWGANEWGQLGRGYASVSELPGLVPGLSGVTRIGAAGIHSLAIVGSGNSLPPGTLMAWGRNDSGVLGLDPLSVAWRLSPTPVPGVSSAIEVGAAACSTFFLDGSDLSVKGFGCNFGGILGLGVDENAYSGSHLPTTVLNLPPILDMAIGAYHGIARALDGSVWTWGYNSGGQLGTGLVGIYGAGAQVPDISDAIRVSAGGFQSFVVLP